MDLFNKVKSAIGEDNLSKLQEEVTQRISKTSLSDGKKNSKDTSEGGSYIGGKYGSTVNDDSVATDSYGSSNIGSQGFRNDENDDSKDYRKSESYNIRSDNDDDQFGSNNEPYSDNDGNYGSKTDSYGSSVNYGSKKSDSYGSRNDDDANNYGSKKSSSYGSRNDDNNYGSKNSGFHGSRNDDASGDKASGDYGTTSRTGDSIYNRGDCYGERNDNYNDN
ncbi:DNA damage-responsive protein 48 Ecym_2170 [Eremothecium cymbalariae DBVPG|uniref:Stress protein DDR48 n=1 Tax=Eremothecium cymbalariae (strain CBS 270.75 / DBVPG 7215 / KCTC 17166 / NRRL Y-17582) TaxID=931890 RepID=G8JNK5_ERECY|nr:Hypothetical protein Ecym_2170 [Eremothecium cymbalariae DBVPG\